MRKRILKLNPDKASNLDGQLDVSELAAVAITSESPDSPIENAFDHLRGPGGSRWVAETPGEQTLILTFDVPQDICRISLEVEETQAARTQELQLAISQDGGNTYQELLRQEFNFSPPGTTYEHEEWNVLARKVTHLRLSIKPDKSGGPFRASLTSLSLHQ